MNLNPLAWLLLFGIKCRKWLYKVGALKRTSFSIPVIAIGNYALGGTGKTPMALWIASFLGNSGYKVVILSRGYGRRSKGFYWVDALDPLHFGDEPVLLFNRGLKVAVCEHRVAGVQQIMATYPQVQIVILDDALQHLPIKAGFNILLTSAQNPFWLDRLWPSGTLRDTSDAIQHIDLAVLTHYQKPIQIPSLGFEVIKAAYQNASPIRFDGVECAYPIATIVITGIANSSLFINEVMKHTKVVKHFDFKDHYKYTNTTIKEIINYSKNNNIFHLLTTEKDWVKLQKYTSEFAINGLTVSYIPVEHKFNQQDYIQISNALLNFVNKYPKL